VADYFKVGISTIRKWIYSGHIPDHAYINIGVTYRFNIDAVEAALTAVPKEAQVGASTTTNDGE
jgi:excisionase family DNA binding protein